MQNCILSQYGRQARRLCTHDIFAESLPRTKRVMTHQISLAAPQVHVMERDAALALEVHTVAAEDGHRARPTCDGRADLLQLRCGLENLHGRLDTYTSPTTRNEGRTVTSANSRSMAPAERPARPILGAQLMISKALQRTTHRLR
jgi:hypothetical protein